MSAPGGAGRGFSLPWMYRWGWYVLGLAPALFVGHAVLLVVVHMLRLVEVKCAEGVVQLLGTANTSGFAAYLIPHDQLMAATVWLAVGLTATAATVASSFVSAMASGVAALKLQQRLHDKLLTLGPSYHAAHDLGQTSTVVTRFTTTAQQILTELYIGPLVQAITLGGAIACLADSLRKLQELPDALVALLLATLVIMPWVGMRLASALRSAFSRVRDNDIAVVDEFTDSAAAPVEVQLMGAEAQRSAAFGSKLRPYFKAKLLAAFKNDLAQEFQTTTVFLLKMAFVFVAAYSAARDPANASDSVASIVGFIMLIPMAVAPLRQLITLFTGIQTSYPYVESVIQLLEEEPEIRDRTGAGPLACDRGIVDFQDVSFSYPRTTTPILNGLTHRFEPGDITAIIARAGGGKSTILNLLVRLWDPQTGRVLIDGQDMRDVTLASLRSTVTKVSQFPLFLSDSIRANFLLALPTATDAAIEAVCERVGLWQDLLRAAGPETHPLDYQLPRPASEGLSGGQLRRLALARALLLRPRLLLLDEPTTGLDALAVERLVPVLREACDGLTVLIVDHNMAFIRSLADTVCCLENGVFTSVGPPDVLLEQQSLFQRLFESQHHHASNPAPEPG